MLLQWYLARLQSHPWWTNLTSAAVLMSLGDLAAQSLEHSRMQQLEEQETAAVTANNSNTTKGVELQRRQTVQYRRYGTLSPPVEELQHQRHEEHRHHQQEEATQQQQQQDAYQKLQRTLHGYMHEGRLEWDSYDLFRTATMVAWSVGVYTPFFLTLFSVYGRWLGPVRPHLLYRDAALRACLTYMNSIPLNAAFFTYGTTVHRVMEAYSTDDEKGTASRLLGDKDTWNAWCTAVQLKISTELGPTVATGAFIWLPINFMNFSVTPAHLRPVVLLSASVFWNAYLSLAQHRDIDVVDEDELSAVLSSSLKVTKPARV